MTGWIKIHREITKHWIWQDPVKLKWWLDVLMSANHEEKKVNIGMQLIDCQRGQCVMSLLNWGKRWNVSKHTVHNFFTLLKNDNMITTENLVKTTRITICNYDTYQDYSHNKGTQKEHDGNVLETLRDTNNNDKNIKNDKKEKNSTRFHLPTIEEIENYCLERENKVVANVFFDFYESKGWMVGKSKMKDWKAAIRTWEKNDKNKSYVHPIVNYKTSKLNQDDRW